MADAQAHELGGVESGAVHDGRALALAVLVCGALAGLAPLHLALLAPLLLGAPHVLEDLRAFVLRPPRPVERRALRWIGALLLLLTLARAQALAGGLALPRVELLCGLFALVAARCTRVDARRGLPLALLGLALLIGLCMARPRAAALFVAHAHNLVALYLWSSWSRGLAWRRVGVAVYLLGLTALLLGAADGLQALGPGWDDAVAGLSFEGLAEKLAPGLAPVWQRRVLSSFVYAQALHFALWVALVPAALRGSGGALRGRLSAWREDLPLLGLCAALAGVVGLPLLGLYEPSGARSLYLNLVLFHGWLELAVLAHWGRA